MWELIILVGISIWFGTWTVSICYGDRFGYLYKYSGQEVVGISWLSCVRDLEQMAKHNAAQQK